VAIYGLAARAILFAAPNIPAATAAVGVLNTLDVLSSLAKLYNAVAGASGRNDDAMAEEIVALQRQRGPDDTFLLERGTTWRRDGEEIVITASAVREVVGADDYAWFVERGTDDTEAQPFFWDSAREVLARWNRSLDGVVDQAAAEFNQG
jgi:hypothetical protein